MFGIEGMKSVLPLKTLESLICFEQKLTGTRFSWCDISSYAAVNYDYRKTHFVRSARIEPSI